MAWDFSTEPELAEKLRWARGFVDAEVVPLELVDLPADELDRRIAPLQEQVKRRGLWAPHLTPDLGGQGFGQVALGLLHEILGRTRLGPVVFGCAAPDSGNTEILARFGTPEQKRRWLDPLLRGEIRSAYVMTEPGAGADPTLLSTRARPDGADWVINGDKWFITNASIAELFIVMAVTDPDADRHHRASQFLVPAGTPGLQVVRELGSMEDPAPRTRRVDNHAEVRLVDVRVPGSAMLGARGAGFAIAQERLGPGRIHHCMRWIGQAQRALDMLCERALSRYAHGSLLSEKQTIQNWIADSTAEINALRLLTLHAAWIIDTQGVRAAREEIGVIKFFGAKVLHDVIDRAIQVHGSLGLSTDLPLEEMYRRARAARMYDGPDEVHRVSVARSVLRRYSPPADGVPTEHVPTRRAAAPTTG